MNKTNERVLPAGFEELLPYVDKWGQDTTNERIKARSESSMEEILAFYNTMVARADEAMSYIDKYPIDDLPEDVGRLSKLVLALAQAAMAVEVHGQPRGPGSPWPNKISLARGATPFG